MGQKRDKLSANTRSAQSILDAKDIFYQTLKYVFKNRVIRLLIYCIWKSLILLNMFSNSCPK
jgi:hypothetical protein